MLLGCGSLLHRSTLHGITANILHALASVKPPTNANSDTALQSMLIEISNQKFRTIFGLASFAPRPFIITAESLVVPNDEVYLGNTEGLTSAIFDCISEFNGRNTATTKARIFLGLA